MVFVDVCEQSTNLGSLVGFRTSACFAENLDESSGTVLEGGTHLYLLAKVVAVRDDGSQVLIGGSATSGIGLFHSELIVGEAVIHY